MPRRSAGRWQAPAGVDASSAGPFDRAIDVAVSRLRRKLEDDGRNPSLIKTVRGVGYVLAADVEKS